MHWGWRWRPRSLDPAELVDATQALAQAARRQVTGRTGADAPGRRTCDGRGSRRHANMPGRASRRSQLAGEIEYAMRRSGSDYVSIPTEMTSGPRSLQGHGTPSSAHS